MGAHQSQHTPMKHDWGGSQAGLHLLTLTLLMVKISQNNYYLFFSCQK